MRYRHADRLLMYRLALTYHPDIGTFRGSRGAWRVVRCWRAVDYAPPVAGIFYDEKGVTPVLYIDSLTRFRTGVFVNPTALMRAVLAQRRAQEQPVHQPMEVAA